MRRFLQSKAWVLDVGHGNATVVESDGHVSVIDGGLGATLLDFLAARGIRRIDTIIVSHVDADHFGGISLLLSDLEFEVGEVFLNPDSRDTDLWQDFVSVMYDARERGAHFNLELTCVNPGRVNTGEIVLEVVAPSQEFASRTSQGRMPGGRQVTANAMSAVVRVWGGGSPRLLLTADIDQLGLNDLLGGRGDLRADVLVFPHHGGLPGTRNVGAFTKTLIGAVEPNVVVFSVARSHRRFPRPDVVAEVLQHGRNVHIACTQLSEHCAADVPHEKSSLHTGVARGADDNLCCAGTLAISLLESNRLSPDLRVHREFIDGNAPTALCRRRVASHSI